MANAYTLLPAYAIVFHAVLSHFFGIVDVAAVDDERACHGFADDAPAWHAELFPFRQQ